MSSIRHERLPAHRTTRFPKRDEERRLLASYHELDIAKAKADLAASGAVS